MGANGDKAMTNMSQRKWAAAMALMCCRAKSQR